MNDSKKRIDYIIKRITEYKLIIEAHNKIGLYDSAVLFETFAQKVCEILFRQNFINLNQILMNYPSIDLMSQDNDMFIQVSTQKDIPSKVYETLKSIKESDDANLQNIKHLYFFVLSNDSTKKVKDFTGESKIGNIDFLASKHLITTDYIIEKSKYEIDFQISLYKQLLEFDETYFSIPEKFDKAVAESKLFMKSIDNLINKEYKIDRTGIIKKISDDNKKCVLVLGEAGSGKSALCKDILDDKDFVLSMRSEKLCEVNRVDDIWNIDLEKLSTYLFDRNLYLYIDALEFIADSQKLRLDLLQQILELTKNRKNIYFYASCRTCDISTFIYLINLYHIEKYYVDNLNENQILQIGAKYPLIKNIYKLNSYKQILNLPFYVNLIIKNIGDITKISDVESLRNYIWLHIICMENKLLPQSLKSIDIRNAINKIALERAKSSEIGIYKNNIDPKILDLLESENIVVTLDNKKVRLKYDIFEDICFEQYIDEKYDCSKGNFKIFFDSIQNLGSCIYRRYQIWVENKLFTKKNREKFLYSLLFLDQIPSYWREQTIIGIIKSNYCDEFFLEYETELKDENLMEFIKLTNLHAFEPDIYDIGNGIALVNLKPVGKGRLYLIELTYKRYLYKNNFDPNIIKICTDYSYLNIAEDEISTITCEILEHFVQKKIEMSLTEKNKNLFNEINMYLFSIYNMAEFSKEWIKNFWKQLSVRDKDCDQFLISLNMNIIRYVLQNTVPALAKFLPKELCGLANTYWINSFQNDEYINDESNFNNVYVQGLSSSADSYKYEFKNVINNTFINVLVKYNFSFALDWLISVTNHVATTLRINFPESITEIVVLDDNLENSNNFLYCPEFWMAGVKDGQINNLIGDSVYLFTRYVISEISRNKENIVETRKFIDSIKKRIFHESNNIIMLSIIAEIGRFCFDIFPGYSSFLSSSIELLMLDNQKMQYLNPHPVKKLYEKQIIETLGLIDLKDRYDVSMEEQDTLQSLIVRMQLCDNKTKKQAEKIIDYLYSIIPNDENNALKHLQIQKMDIRNMRLKPSNGDTVAYFDIKGKANELVEKNKNSKYATEINAFEKIISECNLLVSNVNTNSIDYLSYIYQLLDLINNSDVPGQLQQMLILLMSRVLYDTDLSSDKRSELCNVWMNGIDEIFNNESFIFNDELVKILFSQIEYDLDTRTHVRLKQQMLKIYLYNGQQGIIRKLAVRLQIYLSNNKYLAKCFFNTILEIAKDNMDLCKYNAKKMSEINQKCSYSPNMQKPFLRVESVFNQNNIDLYHNAYEYIVKKYLVEENTLTIHDFDIDNYDVQVLCQMLNCGLDLDDEDFYSIIMILFPYVVNIVCNVNDYHDFLDFYAINELTQFITRGLKDENNFKLYVDLLFNNVDFTVYNDDMYNIYFDVSSSLLATFFDSYNDDKARKHCKIVINEIEKKIENIDNKKVQHRLTSMLCLTIGRCHASDWTKFPTNYSYIDKIYLCDLWSNYGYLHFNNFVWIVNQMHVNELLPEVLLPLNNTLNKLVKLKQLTHHLVLDNKTFLNLIITNAYLKHKVKIKADDQLTNAYENILTILSNYGIAEAIVLLDEFKIH